MEEQGRRHGAKNFLILYLKLNSWPDMFRALAERTRSIKRCSQNFGPLVKVDQLVKEMIQNDETKEPLT